VRLHFMEHGLHDLLHYVFDDHPEENHEYPFQADKLEHSPANLGESVGEA